MLRRRQDRLLAVRSTDQTTLSAAHQRCILDDCFCARRIHYFWYVQVDALRPMVQSFLHRFAEGGPTSPPPGPVKIRLMYPCCFTLMTSWVLVTPQEKATRAGRVGCQNSNPHSANITGCTVVPTCINAALTARLTSENTTPSHVHFRSVNFYKVFSYRLKVNKFGALTTSEMVSRHTERQAQQCVK